MENLTSLDYIMLCIGIPAIFIQAKLIFEGRLIGAVLMFCTLPGVLIAIEKLF